MTRAITLYFAVGALLAGCGGGAITGTGGAGGQTTTSAASTSSSSSGAFDAGPRGACATDADCDGTACVPITDGGWTVCTIPIAPVTHCGPGQMGCCDSDLCPAGAQCFPPFGYCGGLVGPQNDCLADACQVDADCKDGAICVARGVLAYPVRTCMPAACRTDADCTAQPGGHCAPVEDNCCAGVFALLCVYPDGCRTKADCTPKAPVCAGDPATGTSRCVDAANAPTCPI